MTSPLKPSTSAMPSRGSRLGGDRHAQRATGKPVQNLVCQRKALLDFANPDPDAGVHVTLVEHRYLEAQIVIRGISRSPAGIEGAPGCAPHIASRGVLPCQRRRDDAGADGAILKRGGVVVEFDKCGKANMDIVERRTDARSPLFVEIAT